MTYNAEEERQKAKQRLWISEHNVFASLFCNISLPLAVLPQGCPAFAHSSADLPDVGNLMPEERFFRC